MTEKLPPTPGELVRRGVVEPGDGPVGDRRIDDLVAELSARVAAMHAEDVTDHTDDGTDWDGDDVAAMLEAARRLNDHLHARLEEAAL